MDELLEKQLDCSEDYKLTEKDLKRLLNKIDGNIFSNECVIYKGFVNNLDNPKRTSYVNFHFNNKKIALHRLLHINFVGELNDNVYLKFICKNKGKCCNINHCCKIVRKKNYKKIKNIVVFE